MREAEYFALVDNSHACCREIVNQLLTGAQDPEAPNFPAWFVETCRAHGLSAGPEREFMRSYVMTIVAALGCDGPEQGAELIGAACDSALARLSGSLQ